MVIRLFSHAYLNHSGIGNSLCSVVRGLARAYNTYETLLMKAYEQSKNAKIINVIKLLAFA